MLSIREIEKQGAMLGPQEGETKLLTQTLAVLLLLECLNTPPRCDVHPVLSGLFFAVSTRCAPNNAPIILLVFILIFALIEFATGCSKATAGRAATYTAEGEWHAHAWRHGQAAGGNACRRGSLGPVTARIGEVQGWTAAGRTERL